MQKLHVCWVTHKLLCKKNQSKLRTEERFWVFVLHEEYVYACCCCTPASMCLPMTGVVKERGVENLTLDELVKVITPKARGVLLVMLVQFDSRIFTFAWCRYMVPVNWSLMWVSSTTFMRCSHRKLQHLCFVTVSVSQVTEIHSARISRLNWTCSFNIQLDAAVQKKALGIALPLSGWCYMYPRIRALEYF